MERVLSVDAHVSSLADGGSVSNASEREVFRAAAADDQEALRVGRRLRDDVDDTVDRVRAPEGRAGSADHLDSLDVFEQRVLELPVDAREERRVDDAPVDEDEELVRKARVESARGDGPLVRVDLRHFHAGDHAEQLGYAPHAGSADVFLRDDVNRRGSFRELLLSLRDRGHLDVEKLLEREVRQVLVGRGRRRRLIGPRGRLERADHEENQGA